MPVPLSQLAIRFHVNPKPGVELRVPVLVWEAAWGDPASSANWSATAGQSMLRPNPREPLAFLVEKTASANNPFSMGITLGRVASNDLMVDDGSISRFHAWLQCDERTSVWSLTDAESRNGTWVDGSKAAPKQRVTLHDGATLKFGDVEMRFFLPAGFKAFIAERFGQGDAPKR